MAITLPGLPGFVPSPQQHNFFDFEVNGRGNCFLEAVAGAGKTTSLMKLCEIMMKVSNGFINTIIVAFSKKIERELDARIKKAGWNFRDVQASTFHSYGWKVWRKIAKNVREPNTFKTVNICNDLHIDEGYHSFIKTLVSLAKNHLLSPEDATKMMELVEHHDLASDLDEGYPLHKAIQYAQEVFRVSNDRRFEVCDFDDMIYLPVFFKAKGGWRYDRVMVDEAQDTNAARRELAAMMLKPGGRIYWVGDRHQAIFGFTGADAAAVDIITKSFKCEQLPLTVTYRCPKKVVAEAQKYVSHIIAHESAPEGQVETIGSMTEFPAHFEKLNQKDAILCRKTAPLVELAYQLIRKGIACHVEGKDIGTNLRNLLTRWKRVKTVDAYLPRLEEWERKQVDRLMQKGNETAADSVRDRCDTLRVICEGCEKITDAVAKVDAMFGDEFDVNGNPNPAFQTLTLSTVHKSKGREWKNVYIYGFKEWMPLPMAKQKWEQEQEKNLQYVAITRAVERLVYVG